MFTLVFPNQKFSQLQSTLAILTAVIKLKCQSHSRSMCNNRNGRYETRKSHEIYCSSLLISIAFNFELCQMAESLPSHPSQCMATESCSDSQNQTAGFFVPAAGWCYGHKFPESFPFSALPPPRINWFSSEQPPHTGGPLEAVVWGSTVSNATNQAQL